MADKHPQTSSSYVGHSVSLYEAEEKIVEALWKKRGIPKGKKNFSAIVREAIHVLGSREGVSPAQPTQDMG